MNSDDCEAAHQVKQTPKASQLERLNAFIDEDAKVLAEELEIPLVQAEPITRKRFYEMVTHPLQFKDDLNALLQVTFIAGASFLTGLVGASLAEFIRRHRAAARWIKK